VTSESNRWTQQNCNLSLWLANPPDAADWPSGVSCTKRIVGLTVRVMFWARLGLFPFLKRTTGVCVTETTKLWFHTWHLKVVCSVVFLKHFPGSVTHDHQFKLQKSLFSNTQSTKQQRPVYSCNYAMKYSTIQFRKNGRQRNLLNKQVWE